MARDLSGLPSAPTASTNAGRPPDVVQEYSAKLATFWYQKYRESGADEKPMAIEGATYRASWAGMCTRSLQYLMTKQPETDPPSAADAWRFTLGTMVHEQVQAVLMEAFTVRDQDGNIIAVPGVEVKVDLSGLGIPGAAHLDLLMPEYIDPDTGELMPSTAVEIKSINGYGFKRAATTFNRVPPEGPRFSAVVQGALAATALRTSRLKVLYLSLENLSPSVAAKAGLGGEIGRFSAEWTYEREEFEEIAYAEVARVKSVMSRIERGELVGRYDPSTMPIGARIIDPYNGGRWLKSKDGVVTHTGSTWVCDYCSFRERCVDDGPEGDLRVPCPECDGNGAITNDDTVCPRCNGIGGVPYLEMISD